MLTSPGVCPLQNLHVRHNYNEKTVRVAMEVRLQW
jgi:hypothetical protein